MSDEGREPRRGMGAVLADAEFSAADAVGGWRGIIESALPTADFVVVFLATRSLRWAALTAVAVCVVCVLARLVQRQPVGSAIGGLFGVAIGALWAVRSGNGTTFYLPGIVTNVVSCIVLVVTIVARRPLVGLVAAAFDPRVAGWRTDPDAMRTYGRATWLLAALFAVRTVVQTALYLADAVTALGVVKLAMGLPLFALVVWVIWGMHRALLHRRAASGLTS